MPIFNEDVSLIDSDATTIELSAALGDLTLGNATGVDGKLYMNNGSGVNSIFLDGAASDVILRNASGDDTIYLNGTNGNLLLGGGSFAGDLTIKHSNGNNTCRINGDGSDFVLYKNTGEQTIHLDGTHGNLVLGGTNSDGDLTIKHSNGNNTCRINGDGSDFVLYKNTGEQTIHLDGTHGNIVLGGGASDGDLTLKNSAGDDTIRLNGDTGDITLLNADFAEDFTVAEGQLSEPGLLMVIDENGLLQPSSKAYDKKVVGVIAGAGGYRPGLILDKQVDVANRHPIAMMGKVYCHATAEDHPIEAGDLLTSSDVPGYAMKATDPLKGFGAVIGKALKPLASGRGSIPVIISLQ